MKIPIFSALKKRRGATENKDRMTGSKRACHSNYNGCILQKGVYTFAPTNVSHFVEQPYCDIWDTAYFTKQYTFLEPHPALAEYIQYYWILDLRAGPTSQQATTFQELLVPTINTTLVFNLGTAFSIDAAGREAYRCHHSVLLGYHTMPLVYRHSAGNFLIGVKFKPATLSRWFGVKPVEIKEAVLAASELFPSGRQIEEWLYAAPNNQAIRHYLDQVFLAYVPTLPKRNDRYISQFFNDRILEGAHYQFKKVAGLLYLTPRTLDRYFSAYFTITPKQCLKILRFRKAAAIYKETGYKADWTALGYSDFSHFCKDWKAFLPAGAESKDLC